MLPWRRPVLATALASALFGLVFWAHQIDILLGPGWVLLCGLAARRAGRSLSRRALVLGVGPALLAGAVLASALSNWLLTGSPLPSAENEVGILVAFTRPPEAAWFWWEGLLRPLAMIVPFAAIGLWRGAFEPGARAMLLLNVLVPTAFLFAWGVAEHGGYVLGQAPYLVAAAAAGFEALRRRIPDVLLSFALLPQIVLGNEARELGRGFDVDDRAALVARYLEGGTFIATAPNAPSITLYIPGAFEFATDAALVRALEDGTPADEVVAILLDAARAELQRTGRLVFDLGCETQLDRAPIRERMVVLGPLREALEREFKTTRIDDRFWPLLVVE
jgi:hypothetical protein